MKIKKSKAGRKKISDKKQRLVVFLKESIIKKHGGEDEIREKMIRPFEK